MKVKHADMIKLAENGEFDVIVHWCNCECIMGSMAEQIKKAFPGSYKADRGTDAWDSSKIGGLSIAKVKVKNNKRLVIVNAYTQLLADGNVNFHALRDVMKQVQQNFYGQRIGYPSRFRPSDSRSIKWEVRVREWDLIENIIVEELIGEDHTLVHDYGVEEEEEELVQIPTMVKRHIGKVRHGDVIKWAENGSFDVIVHWCNCECIMDSMAEQIKKSFSGSYEADGGTDACDSSKIGRVSFAKVKNNYNKWLVIVNAYTLLLADGNVNYHALRDVMKQVQRNFYGQRIGYPKLRSAGATGSEGDLIKKIIVEELIGEDHTLVHDFDDQEADVELLSGDDLTFMQLPTMDKRNIASNGRLAETQSNFTKINKRQKTDQGTSPSASSNREQFDNAEVNTTDQTLDESLLNLLVEKLTERESCNDEEDVEEEIEQLLLEGEIPQDLIPDNYWVQDICSSVLKLLEKNAEAKSKGYKKGSSAKSNKRRN